MKNILVPIDGSENSLRAVQYAATLVKVDPSVQLRLLHVLDPLMYQCEARMAPPEQTCDTFPPEVARIFEPAQQVLDAKGTPYTMHCSVGNAGREIASEVGNLECDGVIMGTRGMGAVGNLLIGSVATRVVQLVDVPVTLIK